MDLIEKLDSYPAWKLHRYQQPFEDGAVVDIIYACSLCDGKKWTGSEYGRTPEQAFDRAVEVLKTLPDKFVLTTE